MFYKGSEKFMELQILLSVLKKVKDPQPSVFAKRWFLIPLWLITFLIIIGIFQLHEHAITSDMVHTLLLLLLGIGIGAITVLRTAEKQWPVIAHHVSAESIEKRINEIQT